MYDAAICEVGGWVARERASPPSCPQASSAHAKTDLRDFQTTARSVSRSVWLVAVDPTGAVPSCVVVPARGGRPAEGDLGARDTSCPRCLPTSTPARSTPSPPPLPDLALFNHPPLQLVLRRPTHLVFPPGTRAETQAGLPIGHPALSPSSSISRSRLPPSFARSPPRMNGDGSGPSKRRKRSASPDDDGLVSPSAGLESPRAGGSGGAGGAASVGLPPTTMLVGGTAASSSSASANRDGQRQQQQQSSQHPKARPYKIRRPNEDVEAYGRELPGCSSVRDYLVEGDLGVGTFGCAVIARLGASWSSHGLTSTFLAVWAGAESSRRRPSGTSAAPRSRSSGSSCTA